MRREQEWALVSQMMRSGQGPVCPGWLSMFQDGLGLELEGVHNLGEPEGVQGMLSRGVGIEISMKDIASRQISMNGGRC